MYQGLAMPVVVLFAIFGVCLYLLWVSWGYRDEPGGRWWVLTVVWMALWLSLYGLLLLVHDPTISFLLQHVIWLFLTWISAIFLAFALEYTGRGQLLYSPWMGIVVIYGTIMSVLLLTNPLHELFWTNLRIESAFGATPVALTKGPLIYVQAAAGFTILGVASLLLLETVVSFGPLYRTQAVAVAVAPAFPAIAYIPWLVGLGPAPQFDFTPFMLLPHIGLYVYALFGGDMFEFPPAVRRAGQRAAVDDFGSPVVIVDEHGRIIDLNEVAQNLCGVDERVAIASPVDSLLGAEVDLEAETQTATVDDDGDRRIFKLTSSPFATSNGELGGYTLVMQDVTDETRRKQHLAVLNRILRHNLRNGMAVIEGHASRFRTIVDDPELAAEMEHVQNASRDLVALSEKARRATEAFEDNDRIEVSLLRFVDEIRTEITERFHRGTVEVDVPADLIVSVDPTLLQIVLRNAIENGLEHHDRENPEVVVSARRNLENEGGLIVEVSDNGPGLPEHERSVIETGEETPLAHGSGIGLWLIRWGTASLGGEVTFDVDDSGTTVQFELRNVVVRERG